MTAQNFVEEYYLHDSLITKVIYDNMGESIHMEVEFCFWAQENYCEDDPEVGMISIDIHGVKQFENAGVIGEIDHHSILDAEIEAEQRGAAEG